jgi:hypothetical protein
VCCTRFFHVGSSGAVSFSNAVCWGVAVVRFMLGEGEGQECLMQLHGPIERRPREHPELSQESVAECQRTNLADNQVGNSRV